VRSLRAMLALPLLGSIALGGCAMLPTSGPSSWDVRAGQRDPASLSYASISITPRVVGILAKAAPRLGRGFTNHPPPKVIRFGVGDVLGVTIFEATSGGLFLPAEAGVRPGNFINFPNQPVDANGNISIPYAGAIRARGRTQIELQQAIVDALKNRAIEPQVIVTLADQRTSMINIITEGRAIRIPAMANPERLLDTISRAGGAFAGGGVGGNSGPDTWVMLERAGQREVAPFGALIYEPAANNVYTYPNDTLYMYRDPQTFLAFGALGSQQQIPFSVWRLSLAEAVAKTGGLSDGAADPASAFLYRGETREVAESLGIDVSQFQGPIIPVIYNINLRDPAGYFLATSFEMRNKDVIYVSNAVSVEVNKFVGYLATINSALTTPMNTALTTLSLKAALKGTASPTILLNTGTPTPAP
jgi:polysaccharide export outer membrane protein